MQADPMDVKTYGKIYDTKLVKRLLKFFAPYKKQLALSILILMIISILQLAGPYLVKIIIDRYILKDHVKGLSLMIGVYLVVLLLIFVLQYINVYLMNLTGQNVLYDIRIKLFSHLEKMSLSFFNDNPVGRLVTRVVNDVESLNEIFTTGTVAAVGAFFTLVSIAIALLFLDPKLALMTFIVIAPLVYITKIYRSKAREAYRNIRSNVANLNSYIQENIAGMGTVQLFNREGENFTRFDSINKNNMDEQIKSIKYYAIYFPLIDMFSAVTIGLIIWYGGCKAIQNMIQLGLLIAFIMYIQRFFQTIKDVADKYNILQSAMAASERIFGLLDTPEDITNPQAYIKLKEIRGQIEFKNVWFSYSSGDYVLKNINFVLKPGESVAIVGATGAGKTSIINLIERFYNVQKGAILIDGIDIREIDRVFLRRHIGIVPQDVFLFADNIENNIRLGDETIPLKNVYEAAKYVNVHTFVEKLHNGYKEDVLERGNMLSYGQKQLISFARALAFNPKILILDEATSSLDTETEMLIRDAMRRIIKDRTSIIIAHRLSTIRYTDKIIVINNGEITEMGNHEDLLAKKGVYYNLYQLQFGK